MCRCPGSPPRRASNHRPTSRQSGGQPNSAQNLARWSAVHAGNRMQFKKLEVVARDGIEPSTRGFSRRRRAGFGASKPKTGDEFSRGRPNRPARPSLFRTEPLKFRSTSWLLDPVQRLARIATERFPNRAPNGAPQGHAANLLPTAQRYSPRRSSPRISRRSRKPASSSRAATSSPS
jgi:hypothetical protein